MDTEGIDAAVLFPSRGLGVLTYPEHQPAFAAALAQAYNDWLHDFCRADPERLFGAGMISVYDMDDAVNETRRVAGEYGFRSVFLRSNIVTGKPLHDSYYEPLWDTLEELGLPIGFHEASGSSAPQSGEQFEPNFGLRRVYAQPFEQMMGLWELARRRRAGAAPEAQGGVSGSQLFVATVAALAPGRGLRARGRHLHDRPAGEAQ